MLKRRELLQLFLFSLVAIVSTTAQGSVPSNCKSADIGLFTLPVFPDRKYKETFEYRYQIKQTSNDPNTPTIIFIPGGPGGTSINMGFVMPGANLPFDFLEFALGLPKNYSVILTDPRGSGCNYDAEKPLSDEAFRTRYLASDVLALIRNLKLKNYILIGSSYGSLLATEISARAGMGEASMPRAVVLTGVIGKYSEQGEQDIAFQTEWSRVREVLPTQLAEQFPNLLTDFTKSKYLPFGLSGENWLNFITGGLSEGTILFAEKHLVPNLADRLGQIISENTEDKKILANDVAESKSQMDGLDTSPVFAQIACREIFYGEEECMARNIPMDNPFDSSHWQILSPIYYIQGENDPNTPPTQAVYHFSKQKNKNRFLITVPHAGHGAMLAINECKDLFWQSVYNGGTDMETALRACSAGPKLIQP